MMHAIKDLLGEIAVEFYKFSLAQKMLFIGAMILSYLSPALGIVAYVLARIRHANRVYRFALLAGLCIAVIWYAIDFALFLAGIGV